MADRISASQAREQMRRFASMTNKPYCTRCLTKKFELIPVAECKTKSHRDAQPLVDLNEGGDGAVD